jgi:TRAP-type mannitol/chloroaromatic compound transport system permease small subunit
MSVAAWDSLKIMERSETLFSPPVYPVKVLLAVGVFLLILQGLSKFIKDFNIMLHPSGDEVSHGN